MSVVDHKSDYAVPYSVEDAYEAVKEAGKELIGSDKHYKEGSYDNRLRSITLKTGVSLASWGENVTITVENKSEGSSVISILSTPKTGTMFGGTMDFGKNRQNIEMIMSAVSSKLQKYKKITPETNKAAVPEQAVDVADQIRKLKELADEGILTEQEFEAKKKQLLGI